MAPYCPGWMSTTLKLKYTKRKKIGIIVVLKPPKENQKFYFFLPLLEMGRLFPTMFKLNNGYRKITYRFMTF